MHRGYNHTIPEDWEELIVKDLVKFSGGSQPPLSTFNYEEREGYIRLIQTRDYKSSIHKTFIKKSDARKTCNSDDIIIGRYGPPLFQVFRGLEGAYNVALVKAIPNENKVIKDYTFYYLSRPELQKYIEGLSQRSGGQTGIEMDKLLKYPFPLPPLSEQQEITSILSARDKSIEIIQAIINQLKIRNKGLSQQLLFEKKRLKGFKDSWNITLLNQCARNINIRNKETHGTERLYAVTKKHGIIPMREQVKGNTFNNCKIVRQNWFAYNPMRINIGSIALWEKPEEIMVSGDYVVFECDEKKLLPHYLQYLRKTIIWENHMLIAGNGSVRIRIYFKDLAHFKFPLPSVKEQKAILEVLDNANKELKLYEKKLATLKEQKKGLMQKLLTGEIRVNTDKE